MIYSGQAAIDLLAGQIGKTSDSGESSHWRKYHSEFRFTGDSFEGLQGFGGCKKPYRGLLLVLDHLLQNKFRQIGTRFPQFEAIDKLAGHITTQQRACAYDLDVLRQAITLAFLKENIPEILPLGTSQTTVCVIGDGFASMTALLLASRSTNLVILVNLTKTLLVDLWYLKRWMGSSVFENLVDLVVDKEGLEHAFKRAAINQSRCGRVIAIQAVDHALLRFCPVELVVNIASMQEMDPPVIAAYFDDLRTVASHQKLVFYCCNREEKTLPDGTVTRFSEYPWQRDDQVLVDELCPWHQQYYSFKPPFYRPYDGPVRHRLVVLM